MAIGHISSLPKLSYDLCYYSHCEINDFLYITSVSPI